MTALEYQHKGLDPKAARMILAFYRIVLVCGFLPMIVGLAIFVGFALTQWSFLVMWGFFFLFIGLGIVAIGLAFWVVLFIQNKRARKILGHPIINARRIVLSLALLLANFPVGLICAVHGIQRVAPPDLR
jgi:hypothetical protein